MHIKCTFVHLNFTGPTKRVKPHDKFHFRHAVLRAMYARKFLNKKKVKSRLVIQKQKMSPTIKLNGWMLDPSSLKMKSQQRQKWSRKHKIFPGWSKSTWMTQTFKISNALITHQDIKEINMKTPLTSPRVKSNVCLCLDFSQNCLS